MIIFCKNDIDHGDGLIVALGWMGMRRYQAHGYTTDHPYKGLHILKGLHSKLQLTNKKERFFILYFFLLQSHEPDPLVLIIKQALETIFLHAGRCGWPGIMR